MAQRIRWQMLIAAVSALLIMALLTALALSTTTASQPLTGGVYREALVNGPPQQLIPLLNEPLNDPSGRDLAALLFDGLMRVGPHGTPDYALAQNWQVDPTGTVYTCQLRQDVVWHDGIPFSADDVLFTIQSVQERDFPGDPALTAFWRDVLVERIDDDTLRFTLDAPFAPFFNAARLPILPAHLLSDVPVDQWPVSDFARQPVGTGPFRLIAWDDQSARLEANADYFVQSPFIDQIELLFFDDTQTALLALFDQQTIQAAGYIATNNLAESQLPRPPDMQVSQRPLDGYTVLTFNLESDLLEDQQVRQALAYGLDKDGLIERALQGQAMRLDTPILPGWMVHDPQLAWYAYLPEEAMALLETADMEAPVLPLITDTNPQHLAVARDIANQWGRIGVDVQITELDRDTLRQRLQQRDFVLALHSWARLSADPDIFELWHSSQANDGLNYAGLQDDAIDTALEEGRTRSDSQTRRLHYQQFEQRWIEVVPSIVLYQPIYAFVSSQTIGVPGVDTTDGTVSPLLIGTEDRYRQSYQWFVESSREINPTLP
ncbi:MAG: peptide ABC transporter substrate-binding protein [Chloroflexaceae bacterium]|nr:peptide ABC transporter substrate-binding protein [Chloroflexaceae bacterium]